MATFLFDDPTANTRTSNVTFGQLDIVEDGVNFTFTMQAGTASFNTISYSANEDRVFLSNGETVNISFTMDANGGTGVTGAPGTQFGGQMTLSVEVLGGYQIRFVGNGTDSVTRTVTGTGFNGAMPVTANGQFTQIEFTPAATAFNQLAIHSFTGTVNCFCAGTRISTPGGLRAVETLAPGDKLLTADGREVAVTWLGRQEVDVRLSHPARVNPVRITAGALGDGLPERDLLISADHAIAIDGCLINAGALVNGGNISQERKMPMDGFTYYHVETGAHELLLAEGVAAETFIDYAGRDSFGNGHESDRRIAEMALPRISSARLMPAHLRRRLAGGRAAA